jgi:type IV secretion system protein VirD4
MTQSIKDNKWFKPALVAISVAVFFVAWAWISGMIFYEINDYSYKETTPFTFYHLWREFSYDPKEKLFLLGSLLGSLLVCCSPLLLFIPNKRKLYGDARWATKKEIKKTGLLSNEGILVGKLGNKFLFYPGNESVSLSAPTRSGKGVSVVVPTLVTFPDSMVILDTKGENWSMSAGYRNKHGQDCFKLNLAPRDYESHHWNPLHYISTDPHFKINDIQKLGDLIFPRIDNEAPIWQSSARSLWLGLVLFLIETEGLPVTLGELLRQITHGDERLLKIVEKRQRSKNPLSQQCFMALWDYLTTPSKTRGSVRKSFLAALELFYNPIIDAVTSYNDFDLREIRKKRMSIYVCVSVDDLQRLAPLIRLFFQQLITLNTQELPENNKALKYKCLLLLDEFPALKRMDIIATGLGYMAGYGLRVMTVVQSPSQIREYYGGESAQTLVQNCGLKILFTPTDYKEAESISKILGTQTVKRESETKQRFWKSNRSVNTSEQSRALELPQELMNLDVKKELLFVNYHKPIKCNRIIWYKEPVLLARANNLITGEIRWPSPEVPKVQPVIADPSLYVVKEEKITSRAIQIKDIKKIEETDLKDLNFDPSKIEIPEGDLTDDDLDRIAEQFFSEVTNNDTQGID